MGMFGSDIMASIINDPFFYTGKTFFVNEALDLNARTFYYGDLHYETE